MLGEGHAVTGRECRDVATSPGSMHRRHHQELEEAWGRFSLGASRKHQPYAGFDLLASRIVKKLIAVVLNHYICNSFWPPGTDFFLHAPCSGQALWLHDRKV